MQPSEPATTADDVLGELAQPTDDTPTIISRHPPRSAGITSGVNGAGGLGDENFSSLRGRRLAHFELIEPIGVGGMAAVLRARDTQLDRFVALKILPPEMAIDPENVRRFHQEARSAAKLDHENIARVFFCGEDQRLHFIAFEFVEGENLRTILERRGRLPVGEALHYMLQVSAGLAHAGRRGVVHRDIKPSNIIITPNGRAKLVDMGLARSLGPQSDADLTQSGVTLGTFDYISPEQALEPREADVRSDIYSLGCTFYHMLTGRPPVPEGTAAKKLHHHQHVKPSDPRQLVPDLPAEVAVILDRMMAKQPKDRFQSPEQLVHQLLLARRKLGATDEVPEGVLSVEADLPNPPAGRPFLLAGAAVAAVIVLIVLLDQSSGPAPRSPSTAPPKTGDPKDKVVNVGQAGPAVAPVAKGPRMRPTPQGKGHAIYEGEPKRAALVEWLAEHRGADHIELRLQGEIDLSLRDSDEAEQQGLLIRARKVTIKPLEGKSAPTVRFTYDGKDNKDNKAARVALTIQCSEGSVSGVRFVVDARASETTMAGLLFRGGHNHRVERCEFIQASPSFKDEDKRLASVVVDADSSRPELTLTSCCFLGFGSLEGNGDDLVLKGTDPGGQDAVVRRGAARVLADSCAFGPHAAVFRLESGGTGDDGALVQAHDCSVLVARRSAVFDVQPGARASLDVAHSLFSRCGETGGGSVPEGGGAVLLRQAEAGNTVTLKGRNNRYHNLDGYWAVGEGWQDATWRVYQRQARDDSRVLINHPWEAACDKQMRLLEQRNPVPAFKLNENVSALRTAEGLAERLIGAQTLLGARCVPDRLVAITEAIEAKVRRYLVVERGEADSINGTYASLPAAVLAARPGDVILLRQDGQLKVDPIALNKKGTSDLTVRAYRNRRPVLSLGDATDKDAALFRVYYGKLLLEGLEFRIKPSKEGLTSHVVVALIGEGECTFKNCLITLDRGGEETDLALASLTELGKAMKMDMRPARRPEEGPRLALENCFVRGDGDLLLGRTNRPCELSAANTLVALSGSLYRVDVPEDAVAGGPGGSVDLQLNKVTTYLGGHLLRLGAGKELKGLVPMRCSPTSCLFVPAPPTGRTLIHFDGPEMEEKALAEKLKWTGERNAYGAFTSAFVQMPRGDEMVMPRAPMTMDSWKRFTREETTSQFGVKLDAAPPAEATFAGLLPSQFGAPRGPTRYGADLAVLGRLLRRPAEAPR